MFGRGRRQDSPYDMPNMDAVENEVRRLDDPKANYQLAQNLRNAREAGARRTGNGSEQAGH